MKVNKKINKKKIKEVFESVGKITKEGCKVAIAIIGMSIVNGTATNVRNRMKYIGNVDYSDAVDAILSSDMWSSDKRRAMALIKKDKDCEYYKAVINTVDSSMWSSDKLRILEDMCK